MAPEHISIEVVGQHDTSRPLGVRRADKRVVPSHKVVGLRRVAEGALWYVFRWCFYDGVVRITSEGRQGSVVSNSLALRVPELAVGARVQRDNLMTALVHRTAPGPTSLVARRLREDRTHKFPVDQINRRGVAPHDVAPATIVFVVLEEQMILAAVEDGPVRVVEPALLRSHMIFRLLLVVELSFIMLLENRRRAECQRGQQNEESHVR